MRCCIRGFFNPEGWQRVAGGRSGAQTAGKQSIRSVHPEGMPEFCVPAANGVGQAAKQPSGIPASAGTIGSPYLRAAEYQLRRAGQEGGSGQVRSTAAGGFH